MGGGQYEKYPELWSDEEREEGFSDLTARATDFYPELDPEMADLDVYGFNYGQYFCIGMDFCFQAKIKEDIRPLICLAMFQFFDRWSFQYNEEIMEESKDEIESWVEDHQR